MTGLLIDGCTHRNPHRHGTVLGYQKHRCPCRPCLDAYNAYNKRCNYLRESGRSNYVPAAPIREHVQQLINNGWTIPLLEKATGINRTSIRVLLGQAPGKPTSRRVTRATAHHLTALPISAPTDHPAPADGLMPAIGTKRRLQALVANGWPQTWLATRIGWTSANFNQLVKDDRPNVNARTHHAVTTLYNELWNQQPPTDTTDQQRRVTIARTTARKHGYVPPLAWDDDTIDNPDATPAGIYKPVSTRVMSTDDLADDVTVMLDRGTPPQSIAEHYGISPEALRQRFYRNGHHELARVFNTEALRQRNAARKQRTEGAA